MINYKHDMCIWFWGRELVDVAWSWYHSRKDLLFFYYLGGYSTAYCIGKISLTSPIVVNVSTRASLPDKTKVLLFLWLANLNNITKAMFVNRYLPYTNHIIIVMVWLLIILYKQPFILSIMYMYKGKGKTLITWVRMDYVTVDPLTELQV